MNPKPMNQNLADHLFGAAANFTESVIDGMPDDSKLGISYAIGRGGRLLLTVGMSNGGARVQLALQDVDGSIYRIGEDAPAVATKASPHN